jgi:hypothetical protein
MTDSAMTRVRGEIYAPSELHGEFRPPDGNLPVQCAASAISFAC